MNEQLKKFINDMGVLCEMWTVVYKSFLAQGMSANEALRHTQAFNASIFSSLIGNQGKSEN